MKLPHLRFVPENTKIDFVGLRFWAFGFSLFIIVFGFGWYLIHGFTYGIDFQGGILVEARTEQPAKLDELRAKLDSLGLGNVGLQGFGSPNDVLIRIEEQPGGEAGQQQAIEKVKASLADTVASYRRVEVVGPKVGSDLIRDGVIATVLALLGIAAYVWFRFEWQFAVGALVSTAHDVLSIVALYAVTGIEFDLTSVAAILTIAGYSVNDTVVVYDRIRENLRRYKTMPIEDLINLSVNDTLSRTTLTSLTTFLSVVALHLFGGKVISGFSLAMMWGVIIGTFSSIYVAAPVLMYLHVRPRAAEIAAKSNAQA
jgi:preprotein translocase subunit SecF